MTTACFTICSRNYLAYALTLQKSVQAAMPGMPFFIYLADDPVDPATALPATIVPVSELGLPNLMDMAFRYTVMEFNTAIKADCFLDVLTRRGFERAFYLDPDIQLFGPLEAAQSAMDSGASAVLTPHILGPLPIGAYPGEIDILKSGTFNLGFSAFTRSEESLAFLRWWAGKLHTECYSAPEQGRFVDQRFVDLAPAFIERLCVLRHQGYNVAYWNLARRSLEDSEGGVRVNGQPLVFFHFSGIQPGKPDVVSRHQGKAAGGVSDVVSRLICDYQDELAAQGQSDWAKVPYAFSHFRDGSLILPPMRRRPPGKGTPQDWFAAPDLDYWNAPDPRIDQKKGRLITRLMMGFWDLRPDLQSNFPLGSESGRNGLYNWYHRHGVKEYAIDEAFKPSAGWLTRRQAPKRARADNLR